VTRRTRSAPGFRRAPGSDVRQPRPASIRPVSRFMTLAAHLQIVKFIIFF